MCSLMYVSCLGVRVYLREWVSVLLVGTDVPHGLHATDGQSSYLLLFLCCLVMSLDIQGLLHVACLCMCWCVCICVCMRLLWLLLTSCHQKLLCHQTPEQYGGVGSSCVCGLSLVCVYMYLCICILYTLSSEESMTNFFFTSQAVILVHMPVCVCVCVCGASGLKRLKGLNDWMTRASVWPSWPRQLINCRKTTTPPLSGDKDTGGWGFVCAWGRDMVVRQVFWVVGVSCGQ